MWWRGCTQQSQESPLITAGSDRTCFVSEEKQDSNTRTLYTRLIKTVAITLKRCFIIAFDFFLETPAVPGYSLTDVFLPHRFDCETTRWENKSCRFVDILCVSARTINTGQPGRNKTPQLFHKLQFFCHLQNSEWRNSFKGLYTENSDVEVYFRCSLCFDMNNLAGLENYMIKMLKTFWYLWLHITPRLWNITSLIVKVTSWALAPYPEFYIIYTTGISA